jgi:hypothetical protein
MLAAFPFYAGDAHLLEDLLIWIRDLGGCKGHRAVLVADADVQWTDALALRDIALESFDAVALITNGAHVSGWIQGSNSLWLAAAKYAQEHKEAFWFHEPDCIPVKRDWLTSLETAWKSLHCPPYFGSVVSHSNRTLPNPYLEGCSIYHTNAAASLAPTFDQTRSWTLACASETARKAVNTPLVHHFWGQNKLPPTFDSALSPDASVNTFTLANIRQDAVVFHRNKDGTLIRLLRKTLNIPDVQSFPRELDVVFPFCRKDAMLAVKTMEWIRELAGANKMNRACVLHFDGSPDSSMLARITKSASDAFERVVISRYVDPRPPYVGWPGACNWAFQHAARFMRQRSANSWLWLEPDAIPTQSDWLIALEVEYARGGLPFMGTVVPNMGHLNGVAIYPFNLSDYAPTAMSTIGTAWDIAIMDEIKGFTHAANGFILHCPFVKNGRCVSDPGPLPKFSNIRDMGLVDPGVRVWHPCKDGELIKYLRILRR